MKTRVISGLVGTVVLFLVVFAPKEVLGVSVFILAAIGINELYKAFESAGYKPVKWIGTISCLWLLIITFGKRIGLETTLLYTKLFPVAVFLILMTMFILIIFKNEKYTIFDMALTAFGIIYVVFLFAFVILTRELENGFYFMFLIFIGAWITDSAAYFAGYTMGKKKILPVISPKKTLEGSIGGAFGCMIATMIYGLFVINSMENISICHYMVIGLLSGVISQMGDWGASAIKRTTGIKDYGNLMPGHGGVLDRLDSILVIAPLVYFYLTIFVL